MSNEIKDRVSTAGDATASTESDNDHEIETIHRCSCGEEFDTEVEAENHTTKSAAIDYLVENHPAIDSKGTNHFSDIDAWFRCTYDGLSPGEGALGSRRADAETYVEDEMGYEVIVDAVEPAGFQHDYDVLVRAKLEENGDVR